MPIDINETVPSIFALLTGGNWPAGIATPAEIAAGATPVNFFYPPAYVYRYGTNTVPGTTDMTAAIQAAINVAAQSQSLNGTTAVMFAADVHLISSTVNNKSYVRLIGSYGETTDQGALPGNSGTKWIWGGAATNVTFTANIIGATSGTLTAAIANGVYKGFTFYNSTNPTVTAEQRWVTVSGGVNCTWTGALQTTGNITTGITGAGVMLSCFDARLFQIDGLVLDANNVLGTVCILLDSDNNPSSTENDIRGISLRNFAIGIQWGTSGIANGAYAVGCRIAIFTFWSAVANSIGMVVNSSNAGQVSTIESGGIQTDLMGIDIKICNQLQIQRVFTGGPVTLTGIRISVGIDVLIEGCDFENHGPSGGLISASSNSIMVIPLVETYPTTQCVITLQQNKFNNPVVVTPGVGNGVRILDLGNSWGSCNNAVFPAVSYIPSTGQCLSGNNLVMALDPGAASQSTYGWQNSANVALMRLTPDGGITLTGSFNGYTDELACLSTTSGGSLAITSALTGAPTWYFDFRGTGNTGSWLWRNGTGGGSTRMGLSATGQLSLPSLPGTTTYANDAAAAAGGVAVGQLYRNGSVVQVRVT